MVRLQEDAYIVHTETGSILVPGSEIRKVDGRSRPGEALEAGDVPFVQNTYEEIRPDDVVVVRSTVTYRNGPAVATQSQWGLAPHELGMLASYRVLDEFGNEVPYTVSDVPGSAGKRIVLTLPRPVLAGEQGRLTTIFESRDQVLREGEDRIYRIMGDYPDNRLVTRTVVLPAGARVVSVSPEPLQRIETGGRTLVIWRRYFRRAERSPWEIRYQFPAAR